MAYEHKEGQGSLFKNDKLNDRQPDFKGTIMIGGTTYEIAAWNRTSQNGREYLSLQASLPRQNDATPHQGGYQQRPGNPQGQYQQQYRQTPPPAAPAPSYDDLPQGDEDLPF
jgi:hypothetical protein